MLTKEEKATRKTVNKDVVLLNKDMVLLIKEYARLGYKQTHGKTDKDFEEFWKKTVEGSFPNH
jgi:hypothetical protein